VRVEARAQSTSSPEGGRSTAEQCIKEGKNALVWTRLSCRGFDANVVRLQLHTLAYNLANFMRTVALPQEVKQWSLTTLRRARQDRRQGGAPWPVRDLPACRGGVPRTLFAEILRLIEQLRPKKTGATRRAAGAAPSKISAVRPRGAR
jgi:hypothetical protein